MSLLANSVRSATTTTGTGTVTPGTAVAKYLSFSEASLATNGKYAYRLEEGNDFEIGEGTWNGTTLTRDTVTVSKISGSVSTTKMNLAGTAEVMLVARVADLVPTDLQRMVATMAMQIADTINLPIYTDSYFSDSFDTLTYVDTAGATNLDSATAGVLKPTVNSTTQTIGTSSGTVNYAAQTVFDAVTFLTNNDVISDIGVSLVNAATVTVKIAKRNSSTNYDIVVSESFSHPGGGLAYKTLSSLYTIPASGSYMVGVYISGVNSIRAAALNRGVVVGSDPGVGTGITFSEASSANVPGFAVKKNPTVNNMTVASNTITLGATAAVIAGAMIVDEVDAGVAGTDYTIELSANGGSNYTTATLTEKSNIVTPDGTRRLVEIGETALANTGTSLKWRFKNLNNKDIRPYSIALRAAA